MTTARKKSSNRSAGSAARRWFVIPLVLGLLGAAVGYFVGSTSKASAEALLLVRSDASDVAGRQLAAENTAVQLNTSETFTAAAQRVGEDGNDLQQRSQIGTRPNSQLVSISVTAATTQQAVRDANALAEASVSAGPDRTPRALSQLTESTRNLINSEQLRNASAERARVSRLGDELGASQAALVADAYQVQLLQSAQPSQRLPGAPVLGAMGALSGVLIGLALALLLGTRRGTVRSARELTDLYPHAAVIGGGDIKQTLELEPDVRTVIVAGTRGTKLGSVTEAVRESLSATGKKVVLFDKLAEAPLHESPNGHVNLVATTLSETVLRRTTRDEGSVLIVPVRPKVTKLEAVDGVASRLSERSYLLVEDKAPEWD